MERGAQEAPPPILRVQVHSLRVWTIHGAPAPHEQPTRKQVMEALPNRTRPRTPGPATRVPACVSPSCRGPRASARRPASGRRSAVQRAAESIVRSDVSTRRLETPGERDEHHMHGRRHRGETDAPGGSPVLSRHYERNATRDGSGPDAVTVRRDRSTFASHRVAGPPPA